MGGHWGAWGGGLGGYLEEPLWGTYGSGELGGGIHVGLGGHVGYMEGFRGVSGGLCGTRGAREGAHPGGLWGSYGADPQPRPPGQCVIQVLPPLPTRGLGPADVPALTERVRAAMLEAFEALSAELRPTAPAPAPQ